MPCQSSSNLPRISLARSSYNWWKQVAVREGRLQATRALAGALWEFVRDSAPGRRRLRYGDAEFDWDHRVDTTSGTVSWRERLLGIFHSPYQPTDSVLFHEMLAALASQTHCEFHNFVFIDLGSGKGRALMMAADYLFRRIIGVELLPQLHGITQENLSRYKSESQKCFAIESICQDATHYVFPAEPVVLYLFNPLPEAGLRRVIINLEESLRAQPRQVFVLYHNPLLEHVLSNNHSWKKLAGTHQYAIFAGLAQSNNNSM
jgi:hypothetical protein